MVHAARPATGVTPVEANHWNERAEALLAPLLHAAALAGEGIETLVGWVNRRSPDEPTDILGDKGSPTAADLLAGIVATDEREQSGIWSTASGVLVGYRLDAALASATNPTSIRLPLSPGATPSTSAQPADSKCSSRPSLSGCWKT